MCCQGNKLLPSLLLAGLLLSVSGLEMFIFLVFFPILSIFAVEFEGFRLNADRAEVILPLECRSLYDVRPWFSYGSLLSLKAGAQTHRPPFD